MPRIKTKVRPDRIGKAYGVELAKDVRELIKLVDKNILPLMSKQKKRLNSEKFNNSVSDIIAAAIKIVWRVFISNITKGKSTNSALSDYYDRKAMKVGRAVNKFNEFHFTRIQNFLIGVDPISATPWLKDELDLFAEKNAGLIVTMEEKYLSDVQSITLNGLQRGDSLKTMTSQIKELGGQAEGRSRVIARDQVNKLNGTIEMLRATDNGVKEYNWHTNLDGRERSRHAQLNNTRHKWSKRPKTNDSKTLTQHNHPGEDIQCRCWAENIYPQLEK